MQTELSDTEEMDDYEVEGGSDSEDEICSNPKFVNQVREDEVWKFDSVSTISPNVEETPLMTIDNSGRRTIDQFRNTTSIKPKGTNPHESFKAADDDGQTCIICFEPWSSIGQHRIVSLKCGHLFGKMCIERWLAGPGAKCPQCNKRASKQDVRIIFAKCVKVADNTEKESLLREIERLKTETATIKKEKAIQSMRMAVDSQVIKKLHEELKIIKESSRSMSAITKRGARQFKLYLQQMFNTSKDGGCRVMAFNEWLNMLVVSTPRNSDLFPGFGIKKINILDMRIESYIHLHSKQIRGLQFNPHKRDLLLSVSLDKTAKLINVLSNATVITYTTIHPIWNCCWNTKKSTEFFVGTAAGLVYQFDTVINTTEPLRSIKVNGTGPVMAVSYVPLDDTKEFYFSGILATRMNSISFLEALEGRIKEHILPIEGTFSHSCFDPVSRLLLVTHRPSNQSSHAQHIIYDLIAVNTSLDPTKIETSVTTTELHAFYGSTTMRVLAKSCLASKQTVDEKTVVMFSEESSCSVKVFDIRTLSQLQVIKPGAHIIDIVPMKNSHGMYVAMLAENFVKLYEWVE